MAEHNGSGEQERGLQQQNQTSLERRSQVQYYGDREWHRGIDRYGNPVWYRAYGWSWTAGGEPGRHEEEPHAHGTDRVQALQALG